jgi:hypothetical protein
MKPKERLEARRLRNLGHSIKDICQVLHVSKASVSLWVRDIELTAAQIEQLNQRVMRSRQRFSYLSRCGGANTNKADAAKRHLAFQAAGYREAATDERFRLLCALYWGEGTKHDRNTFAVSNCDPTLLRLVFRWLNSAGFRDRIALSVQYYDENGLAEQAIREWWLAQLPGLDSNCLRKFSRCTIHRASQRKKIGKQPYGTATVRVCSTELFFRVMGGIQYLRDLGDW